jgi:hypothetical protein
MSVDTGAGFDKFRTTTYVLLKEWKIYVCCKSKMLYLSQALDYNVCKF